MFNMVYQIMSAHPTNPVYLSFKTKTMKTFCVSVKGFAARVLLFFVTMEP